MSSKEIIRSDLQWFHSQQCHLASRLLNIPTKPKREPDIYLLTNHAFMSVSTTFSSNDCECRYIILRQHYACNYTSLEKYFAIFQYCAKRNPKQALPQTFDIRVSHVFCYKLRFFLSLDTKKEQKPSAPPKASAHCIDNEGIQQDSRYCSFLTVHVEQTQ